MKRVLSNSGTGVNMKKDVMQVRPHSIGTGRVDFKATRRTHSIDDRSSKPPAGYCKLARDAASSTREVNVAEVNILQNAAHQ